MSEVDTILAHHGVKGMKWGVRRLSGGGTTGRRGKLPSSADFKKAEIAKSKVKRGKTHALTNDELQSLVKRMNLEKQYSQLASNNKRKIVGAKFAGEVLSGVAKQQATRLASDVATKQINDILKKATKS